MAEEANDVKPVVAVPEPTPAVPSTEENKVEEVVDEQAKADKEVADSILKPDTEDSKEEPAKVDEPIESDETKVEEQPKAKNEATNRIRTLANENRELRQKVEQLNSQAYKPATEQELVDEGLSETEAKVEALRQDIEVERFNRQVSELNSSLETESLQVLSDFPMFDPGTEEKPNPEYNPQLATQVQNLYRQAAGIQTDPNTGLVISANVLPYNFYKTFADAVEQTAQENQIKGQQATEKMLSAVDAPSSAAPSHQEKDPFLEGLLGKPNS